MREDTGAESKRSEGGGGVSLVEFVHQLHCLVDAKVAGGACKLQLTPHRSPWRLHMRLATTGPKISDSNVVRQLAMQALAASHCDNIAWRTRCLQALTRSLGDLVAHARPRLSAALHTVSVAAVDHAALLSALHLVDGKLSGVHQAQRDWVAQLGAGRSKLLDWAARRS